MASQSVNDGSGLHTNPRLYEKLHGFTSARVARAGGVATPLWVVALAAVYPATGRVAGTISTVYTLVVENATGGAATGWLEVGGVAITPVYHLNNNETAVISFAAGMNVGNVDVNCNSSINGVVFQVIGTEE